MANNHSTLTSLFTDIADAIRAKTGGTEPIVADNFPSVIAGIESGASEVQSISMSMKSSPQAAGAVAYTAESVTRYLGSRIYFSLVIEDGSITYGAILPKADEVVETGTCYLNYNDPSVGVAVNEDAEGQVYCGYILVTL